MTIAQGLVAFDRQTEYLAGEWRLEGITLAELQRMWNRPADDPMYAEYPVGDEHVERLERAAGIRLELDRFDYFVSPSTVS